MIVLKIKLVVVKDNREGHFRRYLWNIFFIPVNLGPIQIQSGLAWNVTDVSIPALDLEEVSIRPAGVISAEVGMQLTENIVFTAMSRYENIVSDFEDTTAGQMDISGETISAFSGLQVQF
ncbi:hypothetical protein [Halanaerobaculum tunisiense]